MKTQDLLKIASMSLLALALVAVPACSDDGEDEAGEAGDGDGDGDGDTAGIRVMHLGVGVPAVDVFANEAEPAAVTGLEFRQGTEYLALPAADYTFQVSVAPGSLDAVAIEAGPLSLEAGVNYTAVAVGTLDDQDEADLEILALGDAPPADAANLSLQVVHAAPVAGQVDIWNITDAENPAPLLENVDYKASGVVEVPPAAYVLGIDVDDDATPDLTFDVDLSGVAAGTQLNVFASNGVDGLADFALAALLPDGNVLTIAPNG